MSSVVNQHWFHCGSGARDLVAKYCILKIVSWKNNHICSYFWSRMPRFIPWPPWRRSKLLETPLAIKREHFKTIHLFTFVLIWIVSLFFCAKCSAKSLWIDPRWPPGVQQLAYYISASNGKVNDFWGKQQHYGNGWLGYKRLWAKPSYLSWLGCTLHRWVHTTPAFCKSIPLKVVDRCPFLF